MSILPLIKAPLGVQMNRLAFTVYAVFFGWPMWSFRHFMVLSGWIIFSSFVFCSLLGLAYTFIRFPRSRWILAVLGLLIPAVFWTGLNLMGIFSRPTWVEWPFVVLVFLVVWMGIPIMLALSLFLDKKTRQYFKSGRPDTALTVRPYKSNMAFRIFKRVKMLARKPPIIEVLTAERILAASFVTLAATVMMFIGVRLRWHDQFTSFVFCTGWLFNPTLAYIAIRRMTETGFAWRWFLSALICFSGIALWALTIYFLESRGLVL